MSDSKPRVRLDGNVSVRGREFLERNLERDVAEGKIDTLFEMESLEVKK